MSLSEASARALLDRAARGGAEHAEVRTMATRSRAIATADGDLETSASGLVRGLAVRVLVEGCWGFAATDAPGESAATECVDRAMQLARSSKALSRRRIELAPEPVHRGSWRSAWTINPFDVPEREILELLVAREAGLRHHRSVAHTNASFTAVHEQTGLWTLDGTAVEQDRVRVEAEWTALGILENGTVDTMATTAPPTAQGWEYVKGDGRAAWDWNAELAQLPELLDEKLRAPSVSPGRATVVLDPTNLWLTIHESVGHATELDRALGYEANYAGTSFATPDQLGTLRYGSALMHITGDRTAERGLATVGWDDEGVAAQEWDLVRDGILVGYQLDRAMAAEFGFPRSNGCAYADSAQHTPIQRMPNVSLQPGAEDTSVADLIAGVEDGYYIVGDKSWSIDMQRYNFQFTGQRFHRIRSGRLDGMVRDLAYQSRTPDFWGALVALGGPSTYLLGGALNCGKAQPGQVAAVSHGCPAAVFEDVVILNAAKEA